MTTFISRDYSPATTGYVGSRTFTPQIYQLPIFLHRVLGYSIIGNTGWNITTPVTTLTVTNASNTSPIQITTSTAHGFVGGQSVIITGVVGNTNANGTWAIIVTGANTFTLIASNGNAAYTSGGTVTAGFLYASGLRADGYGAGINFGAGVEREVSIPVSKRKVVAGDIGKMLVLKSTSYSTKNSGCFKISAINVGNNTSIALASSGTTTIAAASNGASLPQATINAVSTTNFPTSGSIFVTTDAGIQTVTYTGKTATTFTGCTGGTGVMSTGGTITNTAATLPQSTITVASTTGFPTSGTIFITTTSTGTTQIVTYTGTTATTFTGCTGGTGIMTLNDAVANLNRYNIDYRSTENPPSEAINSIDWWLYEIENVAVNYLTTFSYNNTLPISNVGINTTIAAGSNGASLPQTTINVVSTAPSNSAPFPSSGTIFVPTNAGTQTVTYTGITGTTFTGCSGGTGTMSTGGVVWTNQSPIIVAGNTHGYSTGQKVTISGVAGNTAANGTWIITTVNNVSSAGTSFSLNGSASNGGHTAATGVSNIQGYPGDDVSYNSRILLQSPHSSGWQVRIAVEPSATNMPAFTVTVGLNGTALGDFPVNSPQTHPSQFFDNNPVVATGFTSLHVGGGHFGTASRTSIVGDDTGQIVLVYTRSTGGTNNGIMIFGVPDNEPSPASTDEERFFCYGSAGQVVSPDFGTIAMRIGSGLNIGMSMKRGVPSFTHLTGWANLDGTSATSPLFSSNAGDSAFISATEVLPIEIWAGINTDVGLTGGTVPPFFYDQKFMGTAPLLRNGRTNFGNFTLTTEDVVAHSITAATNATPIQITTGIANALVTGQTVTISGILGNTAANGTWVVTVINSTNYTLNGSVGNGTFAGATTIAAGSNGVALPTSTINVASTTGFPSSGVIYVKTATTGMATVTYTGITGTTFTGCTGGTGVMSTGGAVVAGIGNGSARWLHLQNGLYLQWNGNSGLNA